MATFTFTFTTAAGAALAAATFALAVPALASADTSMSPSGGRTATNTARTSGAGGATSTPDGTAPDLATFQALKDAIRSGAVNSGAPIAGLDPGSPVDSLPDFDGASQLP